MNKFKIIKATKNTKSNNLIIIFTFLLKIVSVNLITLMNIRNLNNYISEIHLVVQGKGNQQILNNGYNYLSEVIINGISKGNLCKKFCDLDADINNVTLKFETQIKSCVSMFLNLKSIIEIDLSNFDASEVKDVGSMFYGCENLKKINFGNFNTSSIESMYTLFYRCYNLISIDLSNFDTSKVKNMGYMFEDCKQLKYLDLSNFDTSNVNNIKNMFANCLSLIYLNLNSFNLSISINMNNAFNGISPNVKICTNDEKIITTLSQKNINIDCSNICFKSNIHIDILNNKCIDSCLNNDFIYELNKICYNKCPGGSFILSDDELDNKNFTKKKKCYDKTPEGYYLDIQKKIYKKCYNNCKYCYGEGNKIINNCTECKDNLIFINESLYSTNCYERCEFYYYFNDDNDFICTQKCPDKFKKLIIEKNRCIEECKNDNIYINEFNNTCYIKCPYGSYLKEDSQEKICYDIIPDGYYLDNDLYKKCYLTCNKCNIGGNKLNHNCLECKDNFIFRKNNLNITNCYEKYDNNYYFDKFNEYKCTKDDKCPDEYNKLILNDKKCIDDCSNDDKYKYNYKNKCYHKCPSGTIINETNYICYENKH